MKKVVLALVVVFFGFWMFTDPSGLADVSSSTASTAWAATSDVFARVIDFIGEL